MKYSAVALNLLFIVLFALHCIWNCETTRAILFSKTTGLIVLVFLTFVTFQCKFQDSKASLSVMYAIPFFQRIVNRVVIFYNGRHPDSQLEKQCFRINLSKYEEGWALGETGEDGYLESFIVSILQHISAAYWIQSKFSDLCSSNNFSQDWNELTRGLQMDKSNFLWKIVLTLDEYRKAGESKKTKSAAKARIIEIFKEHLPPSPEPEFELKEVSSVERRKLLSLGEKNGLYYVTEIGGRFYPIVRQALLYNDNEAYADAVLEDATEFRLFNNYFDAWIKNGSLPVLDLYEAVGKFQGEIIGAKSVKDLLAAFPSKAGLWLLERIVSHYQDALRNSEEVSQSFLVDIKKLITTAFNDEFHLHLIKARESLQMESARRLNEKIELEEDRKQLEENLKRDQVELQKLQNASKDSTKEVKEIRQRIAETEEQFQWAQFKSCMYSVNLTTKLDSTKFVSLSVPDVIRELTTLIHITGFESHSALKRRASKNLKTDHEELMSILNYLSNMEINYDADTKTVTFTGINLYLSDCLEKLKSHDWTEARIFAQASVNIDADVPQSLGHGRNVAIVGSYVVASPVPGRTSIVLDVSGKDGEEHQSLKPETPQALGVHGENGKPGCDGESSGNVLIVARNEIQGLELLEIRCCGGNGARGQDGGDGSSGKDGDPGKEGEVSAASPSAFGVRREIEHGSPGEEGVDGGRGGAGGLGGMAGASGTIVITQGKKNIYRVKDRREGLLHSVAGRGGVSGEPGNGGKGGRGGPHGWDNAWATISAWWFDKWEKFRGPCLEAEEQTSAFKYGFVIKQLPERPASKAGTKGHTPTSQCNSQQNQAVTKPQKPIAESELVANAFNSTQIFNPGFQDVQDSSKALSEAQSSANLKNKNCTNLLRAEKKAEQKVNSSESQLASVSSSIHINEVELDKTQNLENHLVDIIAESQRRYQEYIKELETQACFTQSIMESVVITNKAQSGNSSKETRTSEENIQIPDDDIEAIEILSDELKKYCLEVIDKVKSNKVLRHGVERFLHKIFLLFEDIPKEYQIILNETIERSEGNGYDVSSFLGTVLPKHYAALFNRNKEDNQKVLSSVFHAVHNTQAQPVEMLFQLHIVQLSGASIKTLEAEVYRTKDQEFRETLLDILEVQVQNYYIREFENLRQNSIRQAKSTNEKTSMGTSLFKSAVNGYKRVKNIGRAKSQAQTHVIEKEVFQNLLQWIMPKLREFSVISCCLDGNFRPLSDCVKQFYDLVFGQDFESQHDIMKAVMKKLTGYTASELIEDLKGGYHVKRNPELSRFILTNLEIDISQLSDTMRIVSHEEGTRFQHMTVFIRSVFNEVFQDPLVSKIQSIPSNLVGDSLQTRLTAAFQILDSTELNLELIKVHKKYVDIQDAISRNDTSRLDSILELTLDMVRTEEEFEIVEDEAVEAGESMFENDEYINDALISISNLSESELDIREVSSKIKLIILRLRILKFPIHKLQIIEDNARKVWKFFGSNRQPEYQTLLESLQVQLKDSWKRSSELLFLNWTLQCNPSNSDKTIQKTFRSISDLVHSSKLKILEPQRVLEEIEFKMHRLSYELYLSGGINLISDVISNIERKLESRPFGQQPLETIREVNVILDNGAMAKRSMEDILIDIKNFHQSFETCKLSNGIESYIDIFQQFINCAKSLTTENRKSFIAIFSQILVATPCATQPAVTSNPNTLTKLNGFLTKILKLKFEKSETDDLREVHQLMLAIYNNNMPVLKEYLVKHKQMKSEVNEIQLQIFVETVKEHLNELLTLVTIDSWKPGYVSHGQLLLELENLMLTGCSVEIAEEKEEQLILTHLMREYTENMPSQTSNFDANINFIIGNAVSSSNDLDKASLRIFGILCRQSYTFVERLSEKLASELLADVSISKLLDFTKLLQDGVNQELLRIPKPSRSAASEAIETIVQGLTHFLDDSKRNHILLKIQIWTQLRTKLHQFTEAKLFMEIPYNLLDKSSKATVYFEPDLDNWSRQVLLRCIYASHNTSSELGFIQAFGKIDSVKTSLIQRWFSSSDVAKKLLTTSELHYWNLCEARGMEFPLQDLISEEPRHWMDLFRSKYQFTTISRYLTTIKCKDAVEGLKSAIDEWRSTFSQIPADDVTYLLGLIFSCLRLLPVSVVKLTQFFTQSRHLQFHDIKSIVEERLSMRWLEAILVGRLNQIIDRKYPSGVNPRSRFAVKLRDAFEALTQEVSIPLLSYFCEAIESISFQPKLENLDQFFDRLVQLKPDEQVVEYFSKHHTYTIGSWERILRKRVYQRMNLTEAEIDLALEVEVHFRNQTEDFVKLVMKSTERQILSILLTGLKNGDWILNTTVLGSIKKRKRQSIQCQLTNYIKNLKSLEGGELIDAMFNLDMNKLLEKSLRIPLLNDLQELRRIQAQFATWTSSDILKWSKEMRAQVAENSQIYADSKLTILAVISRAIEIFTEENRVKGSYRPRDTQLSSVLLFLDGRSIGLGRFGEIATSEGKTDISAILAIHLALGGYSTNIITSSPILAANASNHLRELYNMFDIGMHNICDDACRKGSGSEDILRSRYDSSVLYGDVSSFQTDSLYTENLGKDYTRGRKANYLIVDEVDSMLLDKGSHVLYISHIIQELRHLRFVFLEIWRQVNLPASTPGGIYDSLENQLHGELKIPEFLNDFVKKRLVTWINNAYTAIAMEKDDPYIVTSQKGSGGGQQVSIVDLDTGVEQDNMQYSYGLHQFIQLKHGKRLSAESLKAIFISNLGYFQRYKSKIFGITGTMGTESAQEFLKKHYDVNFFKMPRFQHKRCIKETGIVVGSEEDLLSEIKKSISGRRAHQPTLVICPNVLEAKKVECHLRKLLPAGNRIFAYLSSKDDSRFVAEFEQNPIKSGEVIVSTNLAGRGTDLDVDSKSDRGLHVILTYIPANARVEKQAFGRTARNGKRGSTQYIVQGIPGLDTIESFRNKMNEREDQRLHRIDMKEIRQIKFEEKLFSMFTIKVQEEVAHYTASDKKNVKIVKNKLIQNLWAFWLDDMQGSISELHLNNNESKIENDFEIFWTKTAGLLNANKLCHSPTDFVKLARAYEEDGDGRNVMSLLQQAVDADPYFNAIGHYYLGVCYLRQDSFDNRKHARFHFKKARDVSLRHVYGLRTLSASFMRQWKIYHVKQNPAEQEELTLIHQCNNEIDILSVHLTKLDALLGVKSFEASLFHGLEFVNNDEIEATAIHELILALNPKIHKQIRISKKLQIDENDKLVHASGQEFTSMLSNIDSTTHSHILLVLKNKLKESKIEIQASDFSTLSMTGLLEQLVKLGLIKEVRRIPKPFINYEDAAFKSCLIEPMSVKAVIGNILREKNFQEFNSLQIFSNENFQITDENRKLITTLLEQSNILQYKEFSICTVDEEWKAKISDPPASLEDLFPNQFQSASGSSLSGIIQMIRNSPGEEIEIELSDEHDKFNSVEIVDQLIQAGILKPRKINWSLKDNFGNEESSVKNLEKQIQNQHFSIILAKFHADKAEDKNFCKKYVKDVSERVTGSVGSIKTLSRIKVESDYESITNYFRDPSYFKELQDTLEEDFDRIPKVSQKIPWWSTGAACVALLGILQIAAGITVGVLSGGALINLAAILVSEGGGDMIFAIQSGLTGSFSWKSYALNKVVSVGVSVLTGGLAGAAGASLTQRALMEVGEEILKKVFWSVSKYAVQGLASTAIGVTIEKLLDRLRNGIVNSTMGGFHVYMSADVVYRDAVQRLKDSLTNLHNCSYRSGQVSTAMVFAMNQMQNKQSSYSVQFGAAMKRIAYAATAKLSQYFSSTLGKYNVVANTMEIFNVITALFKTGTNYSQIIQNFALNYIKELTTYFDNQAKTLEEKSKRHEGESKKSTKEEFNQASEIFINDLSRNIYQDGLEKLQKEMIEPEIKTFANRLLNKGFDKLYRSKQAAFINQANSGKDNQSFMDYAFNPVTHDNFLAEQNARMTSTNRRDHSNWDNFSPRALVLLESVETTAGELISKLGSGLRFCRDYLKNTLNVTFLFDSTRLSSRDEALKMGVPVLRRTEILTLNSRDR